MTLCVLFNFCVIDSCVEIPLLFLHFLHLEVSKWVVSGEACHLSFLDTCWTNSLQKHSFTPGAHSLSRILKYVLQSVCHMASHIVVKFSKSKWKLHQEHLIKQVWKLLNSSHLWLLSLLHFQHEATGHSAGRYQDFFFFKLGTKLHTFIPLQKEMSEVVLTSKGRWFY